MTTSTYARKTQIFHWTGAILIVGMWLIGSAMENFENQDLETTLLRIHVGLGFVVIIHTLSRIFVVRSSSKPDKLPMSKWRQAAFDWNHRLLYIVLLVLLGSGVTGLIASGAGLSPFALQASDLQEVALLEVHEFFSTLLLLLFAMHVLGVLHYQATEGGTLPRIGVNVGGRRK